ncbi:MAG: DUF2341 domain-containing protein [Planctomycetota bacterium]|jgi:hypothetical protein
MSSIARSVFTAAPVVALTLALAAPADGGALSGDCLNEAALSQPLSASSLDALLSDLGATNTEHVIDSIDTAQLPFDETEIRRLRWWGLSLEYDPVGELFVADCDADDGTAFRISLYEDNGVPGDQVRGALLTSIDLVPTIIDTGQTHNGFAVLEYEVFLDPTYDDIAGTVAWIGIQRLEGNDAPSGDPCLFLWFDEQSGAYGSEALQEGATTPELSVDLAWCLGTVEADCTTVVSNGVGGTPWSVAHGDLDGVNGPDLVAANFVNNAVSVLLNNGDGTYAPDVFYGAGNRPQSVAIGDLDGVNGPDLAVANLLSNDVSILLNNGDGTFALDVLYAAGVGPRYVDLADLDGVNGLDLAVANKTGDMVSVLLNNGDGTFAPVVMYPVGNEPETVVTGDLDGVNGPDLVVVNSFDSNVSVLLNNGDGTFAAEVTYVTGFFPIRAALADLDGVNGLDLAVTNLGEDTVSVLFNNGDGTFGAMTSYGVGVAALAITAGDVDLDGDVDLAVTNRDSDDVSVLLNDGAGGLREGLLMQAGDAPGSITVADLDEDGDVDYAVANRDSDDVTVIYNNCPGACCTGGGVCTIELRVDCLALGGIYSGDDTTCDLVSGLCNDDCSTPFIVGEGDHAFTTVGASTDGPALDPSCEEGGAPLDFVNDIWYRFTTTAGATLRVSTCDQADYNTRLAVYTGECGALTLVACNDDDPGCSGQTSHLEFAVTPGQDLLIRLGGFDTDGSGTLTIEQLQGACCLADNSCLVTYPADCASLDGQYSGDESTCKGFVCNDDCSNAFIISDGDTPFSTVDATTDGPALPGSCTPPLDMVNDVWFRYTATANGFLVVSTCNQADYDSRLAVYTPDCGDLIALACSNDAPGCGLTSELSIDLLVGEEILIRVGGFDGSGTGTLTLTPPGPAFAGVSVELTDSSGGMDTYRLYADFTNPADVLAVFADPAQEIVFSSSNPLFNDGGVNAGLMAEDFAALPAGDPRDSWVTIGFDTATDNTTIYNPGFAGSNGVDAIITGTAWGDVSGGWSNSDFLNPVTGTHVLIAQFTFPTDTSWSLGGGITWGPFISEPFFVEIDIACPADIDGSGDVGFGDILQVIGNWGPCPPECPQDLSGNGAVDFADILVIIGSWGPCSELPAGACCLMDGSCFEGTAADCAASDGTFIGSFSTCLAANCVPVPTGGCCYEDGTCLVQTEDECLTGSGTYAGDDVDCVTANCPPGGACCFDDGICTFVTDAACTGAGGTYQGDGVDCVTAACPQPGACCFSDGACTFGFEPDCTGAGGTYQGDNIDCVTAACPQPGACCFEDGSCTFGFEADCTAAGGTYQGPGVNCFGAECPEPGACCLGDGSCITDLEDLCTAAGGTFQGEAVECVTVTCPQPGACCLADGTCLFVVESTCTTAGGTFQGEGVDCVTANCPQPGACCFGNGSCTFVFEADCTGAGGTYQGDNIDCVTADCPQQGACCFSDGSCAFQVEPICVAAGGSFQGEGINCVSVTCPEWGACCFADGSCTFVPEADCTAAGGTYQGDGTDCGTVNCPTPFWDPAWTQRSTLTFNNSAATSNLADFPVLVKLDPTAGNIDYAQTQDAGQDLRFIDADNTTVLDHEIEEWNESGTSYVWVRVPQIDGSSITDFIYMYYGNPSASDGQDVTGTWNSGYEAVLHLDDDFLDSTSNHNDGTNNGSADAAGQVADGQDFDGTDDEVSCGDIDAMDNSSYLTMTAWVKPSALLDWRAVMAKSVDWNSRIGMHLSGGSLGGNNDVLITFPDNPGSTLGYTNANIISATVWHHWAMVFDGTQAGNSNRLKFYLDGVEQTLTYNGTIPATTPSNTQSLEIAKAEGSLWFPGVIDEARVASVARSADWIKAQHLSMTDAFITYADAP